MNLNEYQTETRKTAIYPRRTTDGLTYSVLALCGEAGELANKLKKHLRAGTEPDRLVLADELGDVLWYVASVAHELGFDLEAIAKMNLSKLAERSKQLNLSNFHTIGQQMFEKMSVIWSMGKSSRRKKI